MVSCNYILALLCITHIAFVGAKKNRVVLVPHGTSCGQWLNEDGILITSSHSQSESCSIRILPGGSSRRKLLVRIDQVSLPSQGNVQPTITLTRHADTQPFVVLPQNGSGVVGKIFTSLTDVQIEFRKIQKTSTFKIVITRTEDDILCSGEHFCSTTHYCIDKDLRCDQTDHCGDNSDETHYSCITLRDQDAQLTPIGVIIGGAVVAVIVVIATGVTITICRRRSMLRGFSSRRAPMLTTQAPLGGPAPGTVFMPVPQSDPMGAQPMAYPYPQQPGHWQPPAATSMPPAYEEVVKPPLYPPAAGATSGSAAYQYAGAPAGAPAAGYPVPGAYPNSAAGQPPYPAACPPMPAAAVPYPTAPTVHPAYGNA